MTGYLVEKKIGREKIEVFIENPKLRGPKEGQIYVLRDSPHIDNK
jgi:ASC-1-like (ASCH) protein